MEDDMSLRALRTGLNDFGLYLYRASEVAKGGAVPDSARQRIACDFDIRPYWRLFTFLVDKSNAASFYVQNSHLSGTYQVAKSLDSCSG